MVARQFGRETRGPLPHGSGLDDFAVEVTNFYAPAIMDVSRRRFTNIGPGKMFARGPMIAFSSVPTPTP